MSSRSPTRTASPPRCRRARPSIVADLDRYQWNDAEWIANRPQHNALDAPMSIYEVHLGSWRRDPATTRTAG